VKIDNDNILKYLSGELNQEEKKDFEQKINENDDLKSIIDDLNHNDEILRNMNQHRVSSDFMTKLNEKIDSYEASIVPWYSKYLITPLSQTTENLFSNYKNFSQVAVFSLLLVASFTIYKISDNNYADSEEKFDENTIADGTEEEGYKTLPVLSVKDSTDTSTDK